MSSSHTITAHEGRKIAVAACVDPRTIQQYFVGRAKSTTAARIEEALRQLGRQDLIRHEEAA